MDIPSTFRLGRRYHQAGDPLRARRADSEVLGADPPNAQAWYLLGTVCQANGQFARHLREALRTPWRAWCAAPPCSPM